MSPLREVRLVDIPTVSDSRGRLSVLEEGAAVPFEIRRVFFMHHMEADRGGHAHRDTEQVVLAAAGSFRITLTDAKSSLTYVLDDPSRGVYMPPMVYVTLTDFSPGAVCLVLASTIYDMSRSIRTYEDFLREMNP
jgi:dTDP-4-dehydrorhamnose 3,5-epimerase-like enzyme